MTHKEMTAHIRHRLKKAGISAKCRMDNFNGSLMICVNVPKFGVEFSPREQTIICRIAEVNGLTSIKGMPILDNGTKTHGANFEFHG